MGMTKLEQQAALAQIDLELDNNKIQLESAMCSYGAAKDNDLSGIQDLFYLIGTLARKVAQLQSERRYFSDMTFFE